MRMRAVGIALLLGLVGIGGQEALAYNCDDSCRDQCKYRSPWGSTEINPACQVACQTWKHANCHNLTPSAACGEIGANAYAAAANTMWSRSVGKYRRKLTFDEKTILRPMYSDNILNRVTLHFGVAPMDRIGRGNFTINMGSQAQTYGYEIYFNDSETNLLRYNVSWIRLLAHELMHTQQYVNRGSNLNRFGRAYFEGWCSNGFDYYRIPMEREAFNIENRAEQLARAFYQSGGVQPTDNRYALTCLHNDTNLTIKYQIRWGETGQWKTYEARPNQTRGHWWKYDYANENKSPKLYVRFDNDLRQSGTQFKQYWLKKWAVPDEACSRLGKRERFKYTDNGTKIDLFKDY